jgi:hypothetical protein
MDVECLLTFIRDTARMESVLFFEVELPQGEIEYFQLVRTASDLGLDCRVAPGSNSVRLLRRLDGLCISDDGCAKVTQRPLQPRAMLL